MALRFVYSLSIRPTYSFILYVPSLPLTDLMKTFVMVSIIPPILHSLHPPNSLSASLHLLESGSREEKGERGAGCSFSLSGRSIYESKQAPARWHTFSRARKHKAQLTPHTQRVLKRLTPKRERGYTFKYQNLFRACQSSLAMMQAGQLNQSGSSW